MPQKPQKGPTVRPPAPVVSAIEGPTRPRVPRTPVDPLATTESMARRTGAGEAFARNVGGISEEDYHPDNISSPKRLLELTMQTLIAEKTKNGDPYWNKLTNAQKARVKDAIKNRLPSSQLPTPEESIVVEKIRAYWAHTQTHTGMSFEHDEIPRPMGPWSVRVIPIGSAPPASGFEHTPFGFETDAIAHAERMESMLNSSGPKYLVKLDGPIDLSEWMTPGTAAVPPSLQFKGDFPDYASPFDAILDAGNRWANYRFKQQAEDPANWLRADVQMQANVTPDRFAQLDDQIRRDLYGTTGTTFAGRWQEVIDKGLRRPINALARRMGKKQDVVYSPTRALAESLLALQHAMQLTAGSENFNRYSENIVQILVETGDYAGYADTTHALLTRDGRQWLNGLQDAMAVNQSIVDPRMETATGKVMKVAMIGHRFGSDEGIRIGLGASYEYFRKLGSKPDLLISNHPDLLFDAFPELTPREAWVRVMANVERLDQEAWAQYKNDQANVSYPDLKKKLISDYLTVTLGAGSFEYPDAWGDRDLSMNKLAAEQFVPWGGMLMNQSQLFLIKNAYLRWPGFQLNLETYAPNFARYGTPYLNPRARHAEHVMSMHRQFFFPQRDSVPNFAKPAVGHEYQIDPALREALVQQAMLGIAVRRRLPVTYWWLNRTVAAGARLPLNMYNKFVDDDERVDLTEITEIATNVLGPKYGPKYGPDMARTIYVGLLSRMFGADFSGLDPGVIPGERRGDFFGLEPDEQHDSLWREMGEYLYNLTIGSNVPATLWKSAATISEAENKPLAVLESFGGPRQAIRAMRAVRGDYVTDSRGRTPLERDFRPLPAKYAGTEAEPPKDDDPPIPYSQRYSDLPPEVRLFYEDAVKEAYKRAVAREMAWRHVRQPNIAPLKEQFEKDLETIRTPGPIQAEKLKHLQPKHQLQELFGYRPIETSEFQTKRRDVFSREVYPLDRDTNSGMLDAILRTETDFEKQVVQEATTLARKYLRGEDVNIDRWAGDRKPFIRAREPGDATTVMDRQTSIKLAVLLLNEHAGVWKPGLKDPKGRPLPNPESRLAKLGAAGVYTDKDGIVHAYAELIRNTYNKEVDRGQPTNP